MAQSLSQTRPQLFPPLRWDITCQPLHKIPFCCSLQSVQHIIGRTSCAKRKRQILYQILSFSCPSGWMPPARTKSLCTFVHALRRSNKNRPLILLSLNRKRETTYVVPLLAEMKGFEPLRRQNRPTGFRIRTLQPLGYISIL